MFTGIISAQGRVTHLLQKDGGVELEVQSKSFFHESKLGDSVAINGICLSITSYDADHAKFFSQIETNSKTTISLLNVGDNVNLEHPLKFSDRLGGHLVQGHVDGVVEIIDIEDNEDGSRYVTVELPPEMSKFIADRGSVTLNGVSLTVANRQADRFIVALIPLTLEKTTFGNAKVGDSLNIELDCIARYVDQLLNN